jgi:DNA mismatch repair protein MutL
MKTIHPLSPLLISKIAAGEVIERPAFAVKELIENAIDAGATEIRIYLEDAGLSKIQIVDNGSGMSEVDVRECWKPHTTSKLTEEHQLHSIASLGFRGEALSSLAAVSTLTVQSRQHESPTGFSITVVEGIQTHAAPIGMPVGTIISADRLFGNTPARKKFLKSSQIELRTTLEVVHRCSIAYPHIRFVLTHGKKTLLDYPATTEVAERIEQIVGSDTFSFFIPLKKDESYLSIKGFIAKPQIHAGNQNKQYIFVNARKVSDKIISTAVKEAYGTMLEPTAYPLFVLFITIPFEMVDVNVHPQKEQVHFLDHHYIFQVVKQMVTEVLTEHNLTFQNLSWKRAGVGMVGSFAGSLLKKNILEKELFRDHLETKLIQYQKLYIIASTNTDLVVYDQHAAHERVLFEKLKKAFLNEVDKHETYILPKPLDLKFTNAQLILVDEHSALLRDTGFVIRDGILVEMPFLFHDRDPKDLLLHMLEDLEDSKGIKSVDTVSEEMLAFLSCRASVKAGDELSEHEMRTIITDLEMTPNNTTCPHGRPTRITMSLEELNTLFKRA